MCGPFSSVSVCMRFKGMGDEKFEGILVVQDPAGRTVDYFQGFDLRISQYIPNTNLVVRSVQESAWSS